MPTDTERLDWLQQHVEDLDVRSDLGNRKNYVQCNVTGTLAWGDTLREAIDDAILQSTPPSQTSKLPNEEKP